MKKQYKVDEQTREYWSDVLRDIVSDAGAIRERAHEMVVEMVGYVGGQVQLIDDAFCCVFDHDGTCEERCVSAVKIDSGRLILVYEDELGDQCELAEDSGLIEYDKIELAEVVGSVLVDYVGYDKDYNHEERRQN